MKPFLIILITLISLELVSCKKDAAVSIMGKWNLVSDAITSGIGPNVKTYSYAGVPGDYFDLRTDGMLYIKEASSLDTLSYTLLPDNKITIASFGWVINGVSVESDIVMLSSTHVSIHVPNINNPGGIYERTVSLNR